MPETATQHLTFFIGDEEYAVPLHRVESALGFENVTHLPMAPRFVRGLLSAQGTPLPVLDLAERFGAEGAALGEHPSVLAVSVRLGEKPALVGLLATRLGRVLALSADQLQDAEALTSIVPAEYLSGLLETEGRFVVCLDVDRLLEADDYAEVTAFSAASGESQLPAPRRLIPHLVVRLASERCALALPRLREAIACGPITRVPGAPAYVLGATNVRGAIVTVLDLAKKHGIEPGEGPSERLLVLAQAGDEGDETPTGFIVDAIDGLVQIPPDSIERTPPFGTHFPSELVEGMAPFQDQYVPILDCGLALEPPVSAGQGASTP
jgi:purine-binding chemotaxis protein CheW